MANAFPMILRACEHQQALAIYADKCPRCERPKPAHRKECVDCAIELELQALAVVCAPSETRRIPQWNRVA